MTKHIDKENILKYAAGLLSPEHRKGVEQHIQSCDSCLAKVSHGYSKMRESCSRASAQFSDYHDNALPAQDEDFVRQHVMICDACLAKYHAFVEKKATAATVSSGNNKVLNKDGLQDMMKNNIMNREKESQKVKKIKESEKQEGNGKTR